MEQTTRTLSGELQDPWSSCFVSNSHKNIFRISNTSVNAPNGTLAPLAEENEATDAQNIGCPDMQDPEGANLAPGEAMAQQEGMEGRLVKT